jgi:hypothetical protein
MKIEQLLVLSIAVVFVEAGPARTDCGVTKTFEAKNACSVTYGGSVHTLLQLHTSKLLIKTSTWVECASGVTEMPTFLMPSCSIDAAQADDPTITPPQSHPPQSSQTHSHRNQPTKLKGAAPFGSASMLLHHAAMMARALERMSTTLRLSSPSFPSSPSICSDTNTKL